MVGQKKLIEKIDRYVEAGFPRFTIIVGQKGGGKKLIAKKIAKKLNAIHVLTDNKIDTIREIIKQAHKQTSPILYVIPDADKMSIPAKNALLKITEEPPRQAYFIITVEDTNNLLTTLKSRANILELDNYTPSELSEYTAKKGYNFTEEEKNICINISTCPRDIDILSTYDVTEFYNFVKTVFENIRIANGANALKIGTRLKHKEADNGWDINLFLRTVIYFFSQKMKKEPTIQNKKSIFITSKYISDLRISGIYTPSLIDLWILEMREVR